MQTWKNRSFAENPLKSRHINCNNMKDTSKIISLQELMAGRNDKFDRSEHIVYMRLKIDWKKDDLKFESGDEYIDLNDLYRRSKDNNFIKWLSAWKRKEDGENTNGYNAVKGSDYLVALLASKNGTLARLAGVYEVGDDTNKYDDNCSHLILNEVAGFESLNGRVVIEWGKSQSWYQYLHKDNDLKKPIQYKEVVGIDDGILGIPPFESYNDVLLLFNELEKIIKTNNQQWKSKLEAVNCIYCIVDKSNGKQYVGSTYGRDGIWGRWKTYANTNGHGDNIELKRLTEKLGQDYIRNNMQWIILETLPLNIHDEEAIAREKLYKRKLCTRKFGYNKN